MVLVLAACAPSPAQAPPVPSGEENKTADAIYADARAAMRDVTSYRVDSQSTFKDGDVALSLAFDAAGNFQGKATTSGVSADVVVAGGQAYIRGRDFWAKIYSGSAIPAAQLQAILARVGDNFVHDPTDLLGLVADSRQLLPADIPDCMGVHGKLTRTGHDALGGQRVIVIQDDGSQPGASPARYLVADAAPHRLLKVETHGPQTQGQQAAVGKCPAGNPVTAADVDPARRTSISFSAFNSVGPVARPQGAVELTAQ